MVGVPGRSKACHTCRRRRIKCDGERPSCRNCAGARRVCTGYQRQHAFILSKQMVPAGELVGLDPVGTEEDTRPDDDLGAGAVMVVRWRASPAEPSKPSMPRPGDQTPTSSASLFAHGASSLPPPGSPGGLIEALPREIRPGRLFRDRLVSLFAETRYPAHDGARLAFGENGGWLGDVLALPAPTAALEHALLAVASARMGHVAGRPALVARSRQLYVVGLAALRRDLARGPAAGDGQSLVAGFALLAYEMAVCPAGTTDGYLAHYAGLVALLRRRGAAAHAAGLAHKVFQIIRVHTMFQGIVNLRKTFLAQPEWREVPWSSAPAGKLPFDQLLDILLDVPELSAHRQALDAMTDPRAVLALSLASVREGRRLEAALEAWLRRFKALVPGPLYFPELSRAGLGGGADADHRERGRLFTVAFRFPAFVVARNLVFYWTALVGVHSHLFFQHNTITRQLAVLDSIGRDRCPCLCNGRVDTTEPEPCPKHLTEQQLPPLGHRAAWARTTAYKICQSTEYFFQDSLRGFGPTNMLPPLATVKGLWKYAPGDFGRQMAWVDDMLARIRANGSSIAGAFGGGQRTSMAS